MNEKYLTVSETANYLRLCNSTIRNLIKTDSFYPVSIVRIGRRVLIDKDLLDKWVKEQQVTRNSL